MKWDLFFQGAMFIVFPNVPGATFNQGATLIPESRVLIAGPWYFGRVLVPLRLKNQSLYHKILLLQKFNDK